MGTWNVKELDAQKTQMCIANEEARLDTCKEKLDKLKQEYEHKKNVYNLELSNIVDKITALETSIKSGEKFLRECKNHMLFDFVNNE